MGEERNYGPNEVDMNFKENDDSLEKIDDSLESIKGQPMNLVLSSFGKQFLKNERLGVIMFRQLKEDLSKLNKELSEKAIYDDMDIVRLFKNLLSKYDAWMSMQRQNIFLSYESMKKVKETLDKYYITKEQFEAEREAYEAICAEIGGGLEAPIQQYAGTLAAVIPARFNENFKSGDIVSIHKLKRGV